MRVCIRVQVWGDVKGRTWAWGHGHACRGATTPYGVKRSRTHMGVMIDLEHTPGKKGIKGFCTGGIFGINGIWCGHGCYSVVNVPGLAGRHRSVVVRLPPRGEW
jgi:hypothetical protein